MSSRLLKTPMVPFPSRAIIPARDLDKPPILEVSRLGIDLSAPTAPEKPLFLIC